MKGLLQLLIVIILLVTASAFAALNEQVINLNYFIGQVDTRLTFVIIASFILGGLFSFMVMLTFFIKTRLEKRRLQRQLRLKNEELANIRELPVKDSF